ncbi:MAG TPA: RsiV family protein [Dysgonamonadaceae bacterium]|nr:RsiV family protein [Dysgonamonadaceae bacterium]
MKKNKTILTIAASLLMFFVACNTEKKSFSLKENQVKFDTLIVEKRQYLYNDTANPFCDLNVHFVYPVTSSRADLKRLQQLFIRNAFGQTYDDLSPEEAVERYTKNFLRNYETDARIFQNELQDKENQSPIDSYNFDLYHEGELQSNEFYSYLETLSTKVHFNKNSLLSFQVCRANNKGRAATYSTKNNYVINLQTGNLVTENELFVAGYDVALQQLFENSLIQQNNVATVYELEELGYFGIDEIMPNRNFLIDDEGITYIFNKGEYSAYLLDAPEVFIPFYDLRLLLRESTLISKLAEQ